MIKKEEISRIAADVSQKYFEKDTKVMIDESFMRIKGAMFFIFDLIFFGNKIIISKDTIEKFKVNSNLKTKKILAENCKQLLSEIQKDKYDRFEIVNLEQFGEKLIDKIYNYLGENPNIVYLLESQKFYQRLKIRIPDNRLKLVDLDTKIISYSKNRIKDFGKLGFIQIEEDEKMYLSEVFEKNSVKIYDCSGNEKQPPKEGRMQLNLNDIILVKTEKELIVSYNLYQLINKHSKHQAIKILWTDLHKDEKSNFYIERLDEKYKNIILTNV